MKKVRQKLMESPRGDEKLEKIAEYVALVTSGVSKYKALKEVYPEKYAECDTKRKKTLVINGIERNNYCKSLYADWDRRWHTSFYGKRHRIFERLYDISMDDNEQRKDSLAAMNTLLKYMPQAPHHVDVDVKVDATDDFKKMLLAKKKELHKLANGEDVVDAEIVDEHEE